MLYSGDFGDIDGIDCGVDCREKSSAKVMEKDGVGIMDEQGDEKSLN